MMRFYAVQPSELLNLDNEMVCHLWSAIDCLEAHEQLVTLESNVYPDLKENPRRKIYDGLKRRLFKVEEKKEARALTTLDIARMLGGGSVR